MTETQDQLSVLPDAANPAQERAKRRSGALSSMLLPELKALAGSMGIEAGKLRKSDLVAAIEAAQRGAASNGARRDNGAASNGARRDNGADRAGAPADEAGSAASRPTRSRRAASRPAGAPQPTLESAAETAADPGAAQTRAAEPAVQQGAPRDSVHRDGSTQRSRNDRNNDGRTGGDRTDQARNSSERNEGGRSNADRNNSERNDGGRSNADRNDNQRNQNRNGNQGRTSNEDDEEYGSRRGRRYRDRRGRNRDRVDGAGQGGRTESEPTFSEDDVLLPVAGILDNVDDKGSWFVRVNGYFASADDVYVANSLVRRYGLRRGDAIIGAVRQPREGERKEKFNPLVRLDTINGVDPEQARNRVEFTKLTPLYPQERLRLETEPHILTTRVIDLVMPIGKGQRALIVSPPKAGKTSIMQAIANAIAVNNPECHLMVVLVDERPEEVTDMQRSVKGEVIASTFDRRPQDHTMVAELSIERAKRLVEMGHDVVVLLDSITRLGRAYNLAAPASGRILSGGVDSTALYPPKRFLGAARNIEDGGSLTIIASALVETGSAGDTVIFEEFKGTGNAELRLDRKIADKRVFPAVDVDQSSTRKEEILLSPDELAVVIKLRRVLHALEPQQAIDLLLDRLRKTRTNIEFLMQIAKTAPGADDGR
ncbi:MAG TPA: transcription termination factor Rho [Jatrophihabitans sp.]|nr:transcription termination factor Rho [Jatrophihabitans sp.]